MPGGQAFPKVFPIVEPTLGIEITDLRTMSQDSRRRVRQLFHDRMENFIQSRGFIPQQTCRGFDPYLDLRNAWLTYHEAETAAGRVPIDLEAYSKQNEAGLVLDYCGSLHLSMHWFALRNLADPRATGALVISNVDAIRRPEWTGAVRYFEGWPIVVPPRGIGFAKANHRIAKFILENNFIQRNGGPAVDFVEFTFPQGPEARYIDRPGNTFGGDVWKLIGNTRFTRIAGPGRQFAPIRLKRELRPSETVTDFPILTVAVLPVVNDGAEPGDPQPDAFPADPAPTPADIADDPKIG